MLLCILQESRWKSSFENLDLKPGVMNIDDLVTNTEMKIANGCNAAEIFPGLFHNRKVAVKRVAKHISKNEMQVAHFLCSKNLKAEHLLQPIAVLEDSYFAYFVTPLCEYNLMELIENKDFPERKGLTEHRRLEMCQELLQGLQELHSHGLLHRDLKPENILFGKNNLWISHRHYYPVICSYIKIYSRHKKKKNLSLFQNLHLSLYLSLLPLLACTYLNNA